MITLSTPGLFSRYLIEISAAEIPLGSKELAPINARTGVGSVFNFVSAQIANRTDHSINGFQFSCNSNVMTERLDVQQDGLYTLMPIKIVSSDAWSIQPFPQNWSVEWGLWSGSVGTFVLIIYGTWNSAAAFNLL